MKKTKSHFIIGPAAAVLVLCVPGVSRGQVEHYLELAREHPAVRELWNFYPTGNLNSSLPSGGTSLARWDGRAALPEFFDDGFSNGSGCVRLGFLAEGSFPSGLETSEPVVVHQAMTIELLFQIEDAAAASTPTNLFGWAWTDRGQFAPLILQPGGELASAFGIGAPGQRTLLWNLFPGQKKWVYAAIVLRFSELGQLTVRALASELSGSNSVLREVVSETTRPIDSNDFLRNGAKLRCGVDGFPRGSAQRNLSPAPVLFDFITITAEELSDEELNKRFKALLGP